MPVFQKNILAAAIPLLLCFAAAYAGDSPQEIKQRAGGGDPLAGKEKSALCHGCHGEDGNSIASDFPKLAGQYADYIQRQINNFQSGTRSNPVMSPIAAIETPRQDLSDIAAYFASQKQMAGTPVVNEDGRKLFLKYGCVGCHGVDGKGGPANNSIFPVIGGQHKDYLVKQLHDFRTGARDTDMSGTMSDLGKILTDAEIEAVSDYLSGQ